MKRYLFLIIILEIGLVVGCRKKEPPIEQTESKPIEDISQNGDNREIISKNKNSRPYIDSEKENRQFQRKILKRN